MTGPLECAHICYYFLDTLYSSRVWILFSVSDLSQLPGIRRSIPLS